MFINDCSSYFFLKSASYSLKKKIHLNQTGAFCVELFGLVHDVVLKHKCLHFTCKLIIILISFFFLSDKYCCASEFSECLQLNFAQLKDCGGFQLLRTRGSTRSKVLEIIPCPQDGYTPEGLCNKEFGVGAAVIYIRPLQKDIDLKVFIALKCT